MQTFEAYLSYVLAVIVAQSQAADLALAALGAPAALTPALGLALALVPVALVLVHDPHGALLLWQSADQGEGRPVIEFQGLFSNMPTYSYWFNYSTDLSPGQGLQNADHAGVQLHVPPKYILVG